MGTRKINVILVGPAPPAVGGVAAIHQVILTTFHNLKYNVILLNTAKYKVNRKRLSSNRWQMRSNGKASILLALKNRIFAIGFSQAGSLCYSLGQVVIMSIVRLFSQALLFIEFLYLLLKYDNSIVHIPITSFTVFYRSALFIIASIMFNKKKVLHVHGGSFEKFYDNCSEIQQSFIRFVLQKGDCIIALSTHWKNFLIRKIGINENRVAVLYNCYGLDLMSIGDVKNNKKGNKIFELLFVGNLGKSKGVFDLLEICKELKKSNYKFVLNIGGGEQEQGILTTIVNMIHEKEISEHVKLLGEITDFKKRYYFSKCDAFIFPSYVENFPVVILEAMRAGLPIVTTPVGAIPEIFRHGKNGFLIKPGEIKRFVDAILQLIEHDDIRHVMSMTNVDQALKEFDPVLYSQKLKTIYDRVVWHTEIK